MQGNFIAELAAALPANERLVLCGFRGDPALQTPAAWRPRPWKPGQILPFDPPDNAYVTVASFGQTADRTYRRRRETFAAGRALLVDDVGTKVAREVVSSVPPTAIIETSPGNDQYWYFLSKPERDAGRFDGVIRAFIAGKLLGNDPGMSGVTRVGRLPGFTNGKPQHNGFLTSLKRFDPVCRYSIDDLLAAFNLHIEGRRYPAVLPPKSVLHARVDAYYISEKFLRMRGMLKREADLSGWLECSCPWRDSHTGGVDNGAAIREPQIENQFYGAFRCHHGHCVNKGWADLTQWIDELAIEELERANSAA